MKARKTPLRTCVACARETDKRDLVRIVRDSEGYTRVDPGGKAPGRGAYVCATLTCFESAVARKRLASALRVSLTEEDVERLRNEYEAAIADDAHAPRSGR
jgi:hypothetical protein